jgi:hypothetical protein
MSATGKAPTERWQWTLVIRVYRNFGLATAIRVIYFRVRAMLFPTLALPDPSVPLTTPHEVSILLNSAEHDAALLDAVVDLLVGREKADWEICICARSSSQSDMQALDRYHGNQPWIRVVITDAVIDDETAARWTIEQSTGVYVALVAPGYSPQFDAITRCVNLLYNRLDLDAVALVKTEAETEGHQVGRCSLVLQRKSKFLEAFQGQWTIGAPAVVDALRKISAPIAYIEQ